MFECGGLDLILYIYIVLVFVYHLYSNILLFHAVKGVTSIYGQETHECIPVFTNWLKDLQMFLGGVSIHDMPLRANLPLTGQLVST